MSDESLLTAGDESPLWALAACALLAYLLGSAPWGLIVTALAGRGDVRKQGSGNIGATNVLRTGSKTLALLTLLLDGGKGFAATFLAYRAGGPEFAAVAAVAVIVGHMFPVWLGFRGGKGVATRLGLVLGLAWLPFLICGAVWLVVAGLTRLSSLAGIASALAAPVAIWFVTKDPLYVQATVLTATLVVVRHHANIRRLLRGEEPRIGEAP